MKQLCIILLVVLANMSGQSADKFESGLAAVDITPQEWPVTLRGSFSPKGTIAAHDPLHARSLAVRNGEGRAVLTVVDILYMDQETLDRIKTAAAEKTGWKTTELLIAGTHTHSAPSISGSTDPSEVAFQERAFDGIVSSIAKAIENLAPARIGFGSSEVPDEVHNRRWYLEEGKMPPNPFGEIDTVKMNPPRDILVKPAGPTDPEVAVINVQSPKGKPMGLLANYALHYVGAIPGGEVSADYFGEFARILPYRVAGSRPPEDFVAIMSNGTSGDINNIDFRGKRPPRAPFEQVQVVASKVADAAYRATRDLEYDADPQVAMTERRITLRYRKPSDELIAEARKALEMTAEQQEDLPRLAAHYAVRTLAALEKPDTVDVAIQALRIGDQAIVALPFEVLVEIGLDLKKRSPFQRTMVIELANGGFGYLPPPHQHELGGYETWLGTNKVQKDASVILTTALLEMLGEIRGGE